MQLCCVINSVACYMFRPPIVATPEDDQNKWPNHVGGYDSEVCHHRCAFKLYGGVNSVKKPNYKIWLNDGVY